MLQLFGTGLLLIAHQGALLSFNFFVNVRQFLDVVVQFHDLVLHVVLVFRDVNALLLVHLGQLNFSLHEVLLC